MMSHSDDHAQVNVYLNLPKVILNIFSMLVMTHAGNNAGTNDKIYNAFLCKESNSKIEPMPPINRDNIVENLTALFVLHKNLLFFKKTCDIQSSFLT